MAPAKAVLSYSPSIRKVSSAFFCCAMYCLITSSVTLSLLQQNNRVQHMASPILTAQQGKFVYQSMRGSAFQLLHQLACAKVWRNRNEKMDMVGSYMPFEYFHLCLPDAAYQRSGPLAAPNKIFSRYLVLQTRGR